jgi:hypothetical protein
VKPSKGIGDVADLLLCLLYCMFGIFMSGSSLRCAPKQRLELTESGTSLAHVMVEVDKQPKIGPVL